MPNIHPKTFKKFDLHFDSLETAHQNDFQAEKQTYLLQDSFVDSEKFRNH